MFRLTRKGLWAHKLRFALTGLAVVLGVAFMSGTQILTDTMGKTFDGIFEDANEGVDVVVRRAAAVESAFDVDVRERVDTATLEPHPRHRRRRRRRRLDRGPGRPRRARRQGPGRHRLRRGHRSQLGGGPAPEPLHHRRRPRAPCRRRGRHRPVDVRQRPPRPRRHHHRARQGRAPPAQAGRHRHLRRRRRPPGRDPGGGDRRHRPGAVRRARRLRPRAGRLRRVGLRRRPVQPHRRRPRQPRHLRGGHRRGRHGQQQGRPQEGPGLLQHLPPGLRLHRPVRRDVHHLQHLLHRRRPAGAGHGHAAGHRRQPGPGRALGGVRVGRGRRGRLRRWAWGPVC